MSHARLAAQDSISDLTFAHGELSVYTQVIERLLAAGVRPASVKRAKGPLAGKKFVLTGGLDAMTRPEAQRRIEALGGRLLSSVSKETDFVVVGSEAGSKLAKAKALGVRTLDEREFLRMVGG